mmetsp:Transcript_4195/g.5466  ORF Transcript_4195/g.5466 Transcript_4195/m.5466 type:complete len:298 (+) Transcript_4195:200-1093(+)
MIGLPMVTKVSRRVLMMTSILFLLSLYSSSSPMQVRILVDAYSTPGSKLTGVGFSRNPGTIYRISSRNTVTSTTVSMSKMSEENPKSNNSLKKNLSTLAVTTVFSVATTLLPLQQQHLVANAFDDFDSTDTVERVIQSLKDSAGSAQETFKAFESINDIITEGAGVGGSINYKGVRLERGFVADEDTSIYNPGLSLLTETEKNQLIGAIIQNKNSNLASNTWSKDNQFAFDFLKSKLDPLHMVELQGYLKILPFLGGGMYLVALAVQQFVRDLFPVAYLVSAAVVFFPIVVLIAAGT